MASSDSESAGEGTSTMTDEERRRRAQDAKRSREYRARMSEERKEKHRERNRSGNMSDERLAKKHRSDSTANMSTERLAKKHEGDRAINFSDERGKRKSVSQRSRRADKKKKHREKLAAMNVNGQRLLNWKAPPALDAVVDSMQPINVGAMSSACKHCGALFWKEENKWCCSNGKVKFKSDDLPPPVPDALLELLTTNSAEAKEFRMNLRQYNAAFSMTSIGTAKTMAKKMSEDQDKVTGRWTCVLTVCGEIYHWHVFVFVSSTVLFLRRVVPLAIPHGSNERKFAQVYVCDNDSAELETRMRNNEKLNKQTMHKLQTMLHQVNPYVKTYETARERLGANAEESFHIEWFTDVGGINQRRYNAPQAAEVGMIVIGADEESMGERDVIVQPRQGSLKRVSILSSCYDPMHYVLLFPHGTNGWSVALKKAVRSCSERDKGVTIMQFYKYMLGVRPGAEPLRPYAYGRLGQQYVIDMFCKVESANLHYIENNQCQIRAAMYQSAFF